MNKPETALKSILQSQGYKVFRNGWPDFLALKNGETLIVEVKADNGTDLTTEQLTMMRILSRFGIVCKKWSPKVGFEDITEDSANNLIRFRYQHPELSLQQVGEQFSVSRQNVHQVLRSGKKKLARRDRNAKIKAYYQGLPPGMRSMRMVAEIFKVSRMTVFYAVNGRNFKKSQPTG